MTRTEMPTKAMLLIALLQGLTLMLLHQSTKFDFWPHESRQWLLSIYTFALVFPILVLLSINERNYIRALKCSFGFALISSLLGFYAGFQALPAENIRLDNLLFPLVLTMAIASFKALMYMQQYLSGNSFSYSDLFKWSWRNFITIALSLLFTLGFWLILFLWGALFKAIGIVFFQDLFKQEWFYYPVLSIVHGFGVIIFRNLSHVVDTIARLQQALMKFLLVVLILVSIIFLSALPFTGLEPLWKSGGSQLILWMQALLLFFVNAVYQDEPEIRPYPLWVHRFIYIGLVLLPIYSAMSFYGLSLRVDQYGWSLERCWAFLVWFLLALFSLGYCWGIFKLRDNWIEHLSRVNVAAGLVLLGAMLLVNSPLLDFRKIVLADQLARVENKVITINKLDIFYIDRHLARPGYLALVDLKEKYAASNPRFSLRVAGLLNGSSADSSGNSTKITLDEFVAAIEIVSANSSGETPVGEQVPSELLSEIYKIETPNAWNIQNNEAYYLYEINLDKGSASEYLLVKENRYSVNLDLYYLDNNGWFRKNVNSSGGGLAKKDIGAFIAALKNNEVSIQPPRWSKFEVEGKTYSVY